MIDSNNKLKSLSKSLIESAKKIMSEKKSESDLAKLAPPKDKVTHADVLVGRGVYTHDQVKAHKAKKGIKEDADMVVVNAPVLADIDGELAEVLKRDPRDKTVHIQLEGMKYILKKGQYEELPEAVKNPYAVGMAAAMKATGDEPPLKKSTIVKAHKIAKKVAEEVEQIDEGKWNYPKHMTKTVTTSDMDTTNAARNREERKAFRKKEKAKAHAALMKGLRKEEVEELDELSDRMLASYAKKANKQGVKIARSGVSKAPGNEHLARKLANRQDGEEMARTKLAMRREEVEDLEELSTEKLLAYRNKAKAGDVPVRRGVGIDTADEKIKKKTGSYNPSLLQRAKAKLAKEEVELTQEEIENIEAILADLDEARGRPPKEGSAAWHAKQKQNLDDMPALSLQIRKAASINKPVTFANGESKQISNGHINKFHDHMDARKSSQEKAAFQKRAHKSHDEFVKAVSEPVPGHSKDTGEIVKYR